MPPPRSPPAARSGSAAAGVYDKKERVCRVCQQSFVGKDVFNKHLHRCWYPNRSWYPGGAPGVGAGAARSRSTGASPEPPPRGSQTGIPAADGVPSQLHGHHGTQPTPQQQPDRQPAAAGSGAHPSPASQPPGAAAPAREVSQAHSEPESAGSEAESEPKGPSGTLQRRCCRCGRQRREDFSKRQWVKPLGGADS